MPVDYVDHVRSVDFEGNLEKTRRTNTDHLKRTSSLFQEPKEERRLVRKLDLHILPLISFLYCFSFLDRVNIGNAKLGGIEESLKLTPTQFSVTLALFSVAYILCEVPANVLLKYFRVNIWISVIMFLWGGVTILTAFANSYATLCVARFFLGVFEAGYVPGVMYYLSTFYKRKELATRFAIFLSFTCWAGMVSGPIGYTATMLDGQLGLRGWQFLFIIEGIPTMLLSAACYIFMIRDVQEAKWLTPSEKELQVQRISREKAASTQHRPLTWKKFKACVLDWRAWVMGLLLICGMTAGSGISLFLPTLLQDLGYSLGVTQLLVIPINLVGAIAEISSAFTADRLQRRFPLIFAGCLLGSVSFFVLGLVQNNWVRYALLHFGISGVLMAAPCIMTWASDNWDGSGKAVSMAFIFCFGNVGGIIASFIFRPMDAPRYIMPFEVFGGMMLVAAFVSLFLKTYWNRLNQRRDLGIYDVDITELTEEEMNDLGDRHPSFRYVL
ncbi:hypothetical protein VKS41_000169 [Umbelopsis sp. WA50703]